MNLKSEPAATLTRFTLLKAYMREHVLKPGGVFCCSSCTACKSSVPAGYTFSAGQLSHLGPHYDLSKNGRPLRILVIPMDTGRPDEGVTLEERRLQIAASAERLYRSRNPHMRGTTQVLRLVMGRELGDDRSGEMLNLLNEHGPVHLFDCYAMANLRLCSATDARTSHSKGTAIMSRNCLRHLKATVEILAPTLCIIQSVQVSDALAPLIGRRDPITRHLERVQLAGKEMLCAAFTHPSTPNSDQNWGRSYNTPYLREVVKPTIERALIELGLSHSVID